MNAPNTDRDRESRWVVLTAGVMGAMGVLIGAWGAHGLEAFIIDSGIPANRVSERLDQFDVGARYHLVHAVALFSLPGLSLLSPRAHWLAFAFFTAGIILFSGSLYLLVLTNTPWLGAITPIGGVCWILAWSTIALSALMAKKP